MTDFTLNAELELGHAEMDATHREFVAAVNALAVADDAGLPAALGALQQHCQAHFEQENAWAEALDMPPCHRGEHDKVLDVLEAVRLELSRGDTELVRRLAAELPGWFQHHASTMDSVLASALAQGSAVACGPCEHDNSLR